MAECSLVKAKDAVFLRLGDVDWRLEETAPLWVVAKRGLWERSVVAKEGVAPGEAVLFMKGAAELGLQTADDREYFLSKFGDLVGVVRFKRRADGSWSAKMEKTLLPRVLTSEAVKNALMPPDGQSGLPQSLERVVPEELRYWTKAGDEARATRDKLVESGFFTPDSVKAVDGEMRKVEVKFFLYEPDAAGPALTMAAKVASAVGARMQKSFTPFTEEDWLESLDMNDAPGALAILSPPESVSPGELARAVATLKSDWLAHCEDTPQARRVFSKVGGILFKLRGESDLFASSFAPLGVVKAEALKVIDFQGVTIHIDRPAGYVQTGKDADGNEWERTYQTDYGFFKKTQGGDGEELDVFVGPSNTSKRVFWVTQNKADGTFDEFKVLVGFDTAREARDTYAAHVPMKFFGGMTETPLYQLKALLNVPPEEVAKSISFDEVNRALSNALREKFPPEKSEDNSCCSPMGPWLNEVFDDHAIFGYNEKTFSIRYLYDRGEAVLQGEPVEVKRVWQPVGAGAPTDARLRAFQAEAEKAVSPIVTKVLKAGEGEEHYVLGIVLEPDIIDAQNDTYSADEIRQAEHKFMEHYRNLGFMHKEFVNEGVKILESYLAPTDFDLNGVAVKKGTWLMAVRVNDGDLWKAVKSGGLTGFSIGGSAVRKPVAA